MKSKDNDIIMEHKDFSFSLFDHSPLPFCVIRIELDANKAPEDWTFVYCNDAFAILEGYPKDSLLGHSYFELFPKGERKYLTTFYEAAYNKKSSSFDYCSERINQTFHIDCIPLDKEGLCACLLHNSPTDCKNKKELLENQRSIADNLHMAITTDTWRIEYSLDGKQTLCLWSDALRKLLGYAPSNDDAWEFWKEHVHPDDQKQAFEEYKRIVQDRSGKGLYDAEYRMRNRQGEYHWFRDVAHITRDKDGTPLYTDGIVALIDDKHHINEQVHRALTDAEESNRIFKEKTEFLRRLEEYNRMLLNTTSCGIISYTLPNHKKFYMNATALRVFGLNNMEEALQLREKIFDSAIYSNPFTIEKLHALRTHDGTVDYECSITKANGKSTILLAHSEASTNPDGERVIYTTFIDISENKLLKNEKDILDALCRDFVFVRQCDLKANTSVRIKVNTGHLKFVPCIEALYQHMLALKDQSYSGRLKAYFDTYVDPSTSDDFMLNMDAKRLMEYLPQHNGFYVYRYQLKPNSSNIRNMEVQISKLNSAEGFEVVMGYRIIDDIIRDEEQKKEQLQAINNMLKEQNDIINGLTKDFCSVWLVTNNGESCIKFLDSSLDQVTKQISGYTADMHSYKEKMLYYSERFVCKNWREEFTRKTDYAEVLRQIQKEPIYSVTYPRSYNNIEEYFQISFTLAGAAGSKDFVVGFKNVDEIVQAERKKNEALSMALAAAEHANRAKTQFLNNMSHDIRTPMNAIIGFTSLAASHIKNTELVKNYLRKISTSSEHLLSLINDVLDMSRIESGKVKIEEKPLHLPDLLHDIRTIIHPTIASKQLNFLIDTVDVRDEDVIADKLRLTQVLLNILGNGVKFNKTGGTISLRIKQDRKAPSGYAGYHFIIRDTGIGIPQEFQEHIFESFTRAESSTVSGIQGTGLGLAITKRIVDMMGGSITVKSKENQGSEFDVFLLLKLSGEKKIYEKIDSLQGLRVLVADDDTDTCLSIVNMLMEIGMRSEWTVSGKEAVIRAKHAMDMGDEFYAYIIDWLMPDMNGIETVRRIRRIIGNSHPIIILTAYDWSDVETEAREAGVTAFCEKPLFMSELRDILSEPYLKQTEKKEKKNPDFYHGKKVLLVEDNELNQEIAVAILQDIGFIVDVAKDGIIAVEKMQNSTPDQYDLILMDVQMPIMDGYTATKKIRALHKTHCQKIPVVAMTANVFSEDREMAFLSGMNGYIAKPIQIPDLLKAIDSVL